MHIFCVFIRDINIHIASIYILLCITNYILYIDLRAITQNKLKDIYKKFVAVISKQVNCEIKI